MEPFLNPVAIDQDPGFAEPHGARPVAQALALGELHSTGEAISNAPLLNGATPSSANPLHRVKAQLTVCVGTATLTVGELMAAKEQQVLRLDSKVAQPVDLLLEGKVVARGQLVAVDEHFGVRITELPVALTV
ncbi:flagellar motor switch protein [Ralstonia solanacearum]|nr:flagellar motor switch protein [Ralstonia solanacearum]BEU71889.1 flagellar motor switch protein FliN [Ralstonia pseudosolanacearum]AXV90821.1 flagellar motor switch protein [Ralstonia solanacearum]AXW18975.1 flagellar motor switch protein [Ralstonia solanacearum]AXW61888.1 flagellar motor switch protein [Ralstonia solanacearum]